MRRGLIIMSTPSTVGGCESTTAPPGSVGSLHPLGRRHPGSEEPVEQAPAAQPGDARHLQLVGGEASTGEPLTFMTSTRAPL